MFTVVGSDVAFINIYAPSTVVAGNLAHFNYTVENIGTMNTYGSHMQVGMFSIAAILIGGATVSKATISQALIGVVLFHSVFIISPTAGKALFGDAQIGEFFRAFVVYGVIGISLALHAWKAVKEKMRKKEKAES